MKLIKPSYEILPQAPGLEGVYKQIEKAGRVCYKSENKITETSAEEFVYMLIKRGHLSVLEHGTIYLKIYAKKEVINERQEDSARNDVWYESRIVYNYADSKYLNNAYSKVTRIDHSKKIDVWTPCSYITTNMRVLVENGWTDDLKYLCTPTEYHQKRTTVKFICSRSTSHQLVRHRVMSFAQESQRYCNYSLDKFNNEITFVIPSWLHSEERHIDTTSGFGVEDNEEFIAFLCKAERHYFYLLEKNLKPQQARQILPNACKTELVVTGFNDDWKKLFDLRCSTGADPDIKEIMIPLKEALYGKYM